MIKIFSIYYTPEKQGEFYPFLNSAKEKLHRLEYNPMIEISDKHINHLSESDFIGMLSWKFKYKTRLTKNDVYDIIECNSPRYQVYNLSPDLKLDPKHGTFMQWSEKGHGETLISLIKYCCAYTGLSYKDNPTHIIYSNQFIATKKIYTQYINQVIKPSLHLMENELWDIANLDANYQAPSPDFKKHTGLNFYNYIPFVLERMFMQFVETYQIKVKDI